MDEKKINRIEAYLNNAMDVAERKQFEQDVLNDQELEQLLDEHRLVLDVIDQQEENNLRAKFTDWNKEKNQNKTRRIAVFMALVASITLLLGIYFFNYKLKSESYYQLASDFYRLPDTPAHSMGAGQMHWEKGLISFSEESYHKAINEWNKIENPNAEINYYLAHAYFNVNDFGRAVTIFKDLSEGTSVYGYPAVWYLLLTLLASEDTIRFNNQIELILANKDHPYYMDAVELKNNFEKIKDK